MDLDSQEKEKVRSARSNFFGMLKRKNSNPQTSQPEHSAPPSIPPFITQADFLSPNNRFMLPDMFSSNPSASDSHIPLIVRFYDPDSPPNESEDAQGRTLDKILSWSDSQLERSHNYIQMLFPLPEGSPFNWDAPVITREVMMEFRSRSELRNSLRRSFERMLEFYGFTVNYKDEDVEMEEDVVLEANNDTVTTSESRAQQEPASEQADTGTGEKVEGSTQESEAQPTASESVVSATDANSAVAPENAADSATTTIEAPESSKQASTEPLATPNAAEDTSFMSGYYVVRAPNWRRNFRNWAVRFDHNHLRITRILRCLRILGLQRECDAFFTALQRVFEDPAIHINQRSMIYWHRAVTRPLYMAPDDERIGWLRKWEEEQAKEAKKEAKKEAAKSGGKQKESDE